MVAENKKIEWRKIDKELWSEDEVFVYSRKMVVIYCKYLKAQIVTI